ncbi:protein of unknown function (plasmid) [Rhodovastum atsumiense]|uniref:hypothetical protein n=1 Tax=Rhodovastum atsumiense TaxID=504468 RepID=UPI00139F2A0F|nr:hypothetical protein [Rhodovastum atsumiense]CAH2606216.1 protein of unknown function [Rhodovastum atsumiense]
MQPHPESGFPAADRNSLVVRLAQAEARAESLAALVLDAHKRAEAAEAALAQVRAAERVERLVCPECGHPSLNARGFRSHWGQRHWGRPRPEPISATLTPAQTAELTNNAPRYAGR